MKKSGKIIGTWFNILYIIVWKLMLTLSKRKMEIRGNSILETKAPTKCLVKIVSETRGTENEAEIE